MDFVDIPVVRLAVTVNIKDDANARPDPEIVSLDLLTPPLIGQPPVLVNGSNLLPAAFPGQVYRHTGDICLYFYFFRLL